MFTGLVSDVGIVTRVEVGGRTIGRGRTGDRRQLEADPGVLGADPGQRRRDHLDPEDLGAVDPDEPAQDPAGPAPPVAGQFVERGVIGD